MAMANIKVAFLVVILAAIKNSFGQNTTCLKEDAIQDIRLVDGTYGDFMGRVEIKFNGTWGTVCDDFWSLADVNVVCRMMGFERGGGCAVSRAGFGQGPISSPILLDDVRCRGNEDCLDDCSFIGLGDPPTFCTHREDAGVVCLSDQNDVNPPPVLHLVNATTTTLAVRFKNVKRSQLPEGANTIRYRISYAESGVEDVFQRNSYFFPDSIGERDDETIMVLTNLKRDTEYSLQMGVDFRYSRTICFSYIIGSLSQPLLFRTNATIKPTSIQIRLGSLLSGSSFSGRVEVMYNNTWGTVCDDSFGTSDANVICRALNFSGALCVPFRRFSPGAGPIWLDDLNCPSSAEVLEDCTHRGWGVHNCRHRDDVSVVCNPGEDFLGTVSNVVVTDVQPVTATIQWEAFDFPNIVASFSYRVFYWSSSTTFRSSRTVSHPRTEIEVTSLIVGDTYMVTVSPVVRFDACFFRSISGPESVAVNFTTFALPPTGPPTDFHIIVLNSSAIEIQWEDPLRNHQNGDITSYIVFVSPQGGGERQIEYLTSSTDFDVARIVGGLIPSTMYTFSILAVNAGGRGPRSISLTGQTFAVGAEPIISSFGLNGDGIDRVIRFTFNRNLNIHCGSTRQNVKIDWFSPSGRKVEIDDRNLRVGRYSNGSAVLQIAAFRRLNTCDGGVYTCVANDLSTQTNQRKTFTLIISSTPVRPNRVFPLTVTSNSIKIGWERPSCDGGHRILEYNLNYYEFVTSFFSRVVISIRHIIAEETNYTYTVNDLNPSRSYVFQVQAVRTDLRVSSFSPTRTIRTLPPAPSPPRDIGVRIVGIKTIEISWRPPVVANGVIIRYTIYITLFGVSDDGGTGNKRRQAVQTPIVITAVFSGSATSGNVTVPSTDAMYGVQVTASIPVGDSLNEGRISNLSLVDVPTPVLPILQSFRVIKATNSSMTIQWELPQPPFLPIDEFIVTYSSLVNWESPLGEDVEFSESGRVTVQPSVSTVRISPLTPGTTYTFNVVASTEDELGQETSVTGSTTGGVADRGRVAFVQLKFGPVDKCSSFQVGDTEQRLKTIKDAIINEINELCSCDVTADHLQNSVFSCADGLVDQVVYRARIIGSDSYNAQDLVSLIQAWVNSDDAMIIAGFFRFNVDASCITSLDTLRSPDCEIGQVTTSPTEIVTVVTEPLTSPTEIVTVVIGLFVIIILVGIVVLLSVLLIRKRKLSETSGVLGMVRFKNENTAKEEDRLPFADMEPSSEDTIDSKPEVFM
ncbi:uncharacterized protein LOC135336822 isoform X2 [Halichondria panicea]